MQNPFRNSLFSSLQVNNQLFQWNKSFSNKSQLGLTKEEKDFSYSSTTTNHKLKPPTFVQLLKNHNNSQQLLTKSSSQPQGSFIKRIYQWITTQKEMGGQGASLELSTSTNPSNHITWKRAVSSNSVQNSNSRQLNDVRRDVEGTDPIVKKYKLRLTDHRIVDYRPSAGQPPCLCVSTAVREQNWKRSRHVNEWMKRNDEVMVLCSSGQKI